RSLPSRERSPTPQNADRPPCSWARLLISSWMRTVLPTPAPPNRPTLPPLAVDGPALLRVHVAGLVDRIAEQVEDAAQRGLADGHGDRAAGVDDLHAARQAVGGVHGDRADAVVAEVLLELADEELLLGAGADALLLDLPVRVRALDGDRVVDLGQLVGEHRLDHHAGDLLDAPDVAAVAVA